MLSEKLRRFVVVSPGEVPSLSCPCTFEFWDFWWLLIVPGFLFSILPKQGYTLSTECQLETMTKKVSQCGVTMPDRRFTTHALLTWQMVFSLDSWAFIWHWASWAFSQRPNLHLNDLAVKWPWCFHLTRQVLYDSWGLYTTTGILPNRVGSLRLIGLFGFRRPHLDCMTSSLNWAVLMQQQMQRSWSDILRPMRSTAGSTRKGDKAGCCPSRLRCLASMWM